MSRSSLRRLVALAVTVAIAVAVAPSAVAASAPEIVVEDGVTQPVFGYNDAIRERVWVETDVDSEGDGVLDLVALDIMRPAATEQGLKSPVVMDASPYFTTLCRGNESECIADVDGDGLNDRWPLFYDNYFVPRGYAVILLNMVGTGFSTGCPTTGGASSWPSPHRTARSPSVTTRASPCGRTCPARTGPTSAACSWSRATPSRRPSSSSGPCA